ncbi:hypothetical protein FHR90_001218 [Endobacter medicaginis]|uniref:Peptidase M1 membrane alanine aminopeptidase domain-containing protein n=1 Tax=Endobacter medicaginis TaxID=1181271 RepID=A0A839UXL9_9PROT|nr:M1 family metallopeptidase [Endobacter medicaginis]MBB3173395.1 hypothetical protein [Endobacter medicaginis]MCX5475442.1 M1 family metallopeptidase [Endobacter medicaginis]
MSRRAVLSLVVLAACPALPCAAADAGWSDPLAPLELPRAANAFRDGAGLPGPAYWQNRADYRIAVAIDAKTDVLSGQETITYANNSPDSLDRIWLYLDQNIYRRDARASVIASKWFGQHFTDGDVIESVQVIDGTGSYTPKTIVSDTRMAVELQRDLGSHHALKLKIAWHYTVPGPWGGRTAVTPDSEGKIYEIAQFYPRVAVYDDLRGWDTLPYLGAEFYNEYGSYDYSVTAPANMVVAGSGALVNEAQVLDAAQRARLAQARASDKTVMIRTAADVDAAPRETSRTRTWHFTMTPTRDVAFVASRAYLWDAARINLPDGRHATAMSLYPKQDQGADKWGRSSEYLKDSVENFSRRWYPYPWPNAINIAGHGANMEYPGIVFDGIRDVGRELFWVTAHEIGHGWFPMIVGSNERRWAFMDEGFNTFIDTIESDDFNHGEYAPKRDSEYAPGGGKPADEIVGLLRDPKAPVILTPADSVGEAYRHPVEYFKPAFGLTMLRETILGPERFDRAFRRYIAAWAFRHPDPSDFFRAMSSDSGEDLGWFWRGWFMNNAPLDYALESVRYVDGDPAKGAELTLLDKGGLILPAPLRLTFADGHVENRVLPVETWRYRPNVTIGLHTSAKLSRVELDPDHAIPDADRSNDSLTVP